MPLRVLLRRSLRDRINYNGGIGIYFQLPMSLVTNSPLALVILFLTYTVTGWRLASAFDSWQMWLLIAVAIIILIQGIVIPANFVSRLFSRWLQTDAQTLISFVALTLIGIGLILMAWLFLLIQVLLMVAATILANLELREAGYKNRNSFLMISLLALAGYATGLFGYQLLAMVK